MKKIVDGELVDMGADEVAELQGETPPWASSSMANLEPDQFWMALRFFGYEQPLRDWVDSLKPSDPESLTFAQDLAFWSSVSAKLEWAKFFERHHPFIDGARQALGITEQQLDDMWMWALS